MSAPRATLLRRLATPGAAGRVARTHFRNTRWQYRGYASGAGSSGQQSVSSELPWLFGAVAVSIPGTYLVLKTDQLGNPLTHPLPGDDYHGEHGDEHGDDEHAESDDTEAKDEQPEEESKDEESKDKSEDQSEEKSEDKPAPSGDSSDGKAAEGGEKQPAPSDQNPSSRGSKATGKSVTEQPSDNRLSGKRQVKGASDGEAAPWDEEHEYEHDGDSRIIHKPDAKGGAKRRIESSYGLKQGNGENEDDNQNKKTPVAGNTSKAQFGISNTDTKHSYDLMANSDMSKKPEGVPETAKLQTTVDPRR